MKIIQALILSLVFVACVDSVPDMPKPDKKISHKNMVDVLTELVQLESSAQLEYVQLIRYGEIMEKAGDSLIQSKGYTVSQFNQNMDYYGSRQDEMMEIYGEVKANLVKEKEKLELKLKKERETKVESD